MRFGRRAKDRARPDRRREDFGGNDTGTVASEERSALLGTAVEELDPMADAEYDSDGGADPTQQLLTYLGRFQRQLHRAQQGASQDEWSDEAMSQLIHGVELSLKTEWTIVVEALTDTARVLQTYEDAGQANDALPFLADAYEMLCLMVGDLIVDNVRPTVRDKWRARFAEAAEQARAAGLELVEDDTARNEDSAEAEPETPEERPTKTATVIPFELPKAHTDPMKKIPSELPTLDELPPLESLLGAPSESSAKPAAKTPAESPSSEDVSDGLELFSNFGSVGYMEDEEEPESNILTPSDFNQPEFRPAGPSRMVVNILDQICDQLNRIENARSDQRAHFIERVSNGLKALEREASETEHAQAKTLCTSFNELCQLALDAEGPVDPRFTEIGFAFCGVYTEAFAEDESDTISNWQIECENLKVTWNEDRAALDEEVDPFVEDSVPDEPGAEATIEYDTPDAEPDALPSLDELETEPAETIDDAPVEEEPVSPFEASESEGLPSLDDFQEEVADPAADDASDLSEADALPSLDEYMNDAPTEVAVDEPVPLEAPVDEAVEPEAVEPEAVEPEAVEPEAVEPEVVEAATPAEFEGADTVEPAHAEEAPTQTVEAAHSEPEPLTTPELSDDAARSNELLMEAHRAAISGDGAGAKNLALQAAALFAKVEAEKADAHLRDTERRLKESYDASEQARDDVKQGEQDVLDAATAVSNSESALGEAKDNTAGVTQELTDIEATIADLEEQIRILQERREEELVKAEDARTRLSETEEQEREALAVLDALKRGEDEARVTLEKRRQHVNELLHSSGEIETEVEKARHSLEAQRRSLAEIEQTLRQLMGEGATDDEGESTLLF